MLNTANMCIFVGRIASDIDLKTVGQGQNAFSVAKFKLAVARKLSKDQKATNKANPGSVVTADFLQCEATGGIADTIGNPQWFSKGKPINIVASFYTYTTDDGNGGKKYGSSFKVESIGFPLTDNSGGNNGGNNNNNNGGNSNNNNNGNNGNNGNGNNNNSNNNRPNNNNNNKSNNNNNKKPQDDEVYVVDDSDIPF